MKIKGRIIHKGLILVAIPIIFSLLPVSEFTKLLAESKQAITREFRFNEAMTAANRLMCTELVASLSAIAFHACQDPAFKSEYDKKAQEIQDLYVSLKHLLQDEPGFSPSLTAIQGEIIARNAQNRTIMTSCLSAKDKATVKNNNAQTTPGCDKAETQTQTKEIPAALVLFEKLQRSAAARTESAFQTMSFIRQHLLCEVATSILLVFVFALHFSRNISCRLLNVYLNIVSLSAGRTLNPPLKGTDEIAELDELLYKSAQDRREQDRFQHALMAVAGHELKTPLTCVEGILSSLSGGLLGPLEPVARQRVNQAHQSIKRLMGLVRDLLDLDRLEIGTQETSPVLTSLSEIISASQDSVKTLAEKRGVTLQIESSNTMNTMVIADSEQLVHVIVNLISSALRFAPPASKVTIHAGLRNGWLEARIRNEAEPVSRSVQQSIFEPFQHDEMRCADNGRATGLELTICRAIIEQQGGKIGLEPGDTKGNTFWFKVPHLGNQTAQSSSSSDQAGYSRKNQSALSLALCFNTLLPDNKRAAAQPNILQKTLILVSIPLLFELFTLSVFSSLCYHSRDQLQNNHTSQELVLAANQALSKLLNAADAGGQYLLTQNPQPLHNWGKGIQEARSLYSRQPEMANARIKQRESAEGNLLFSSFAACERLLKSPAIGPENNQQPARPSVADFSIIAGTSIANIQLAAQDLTSFQAQSGELCTRQQENLVKDMETTLSLAIFLSLFISPVVALYLLRGIESNLQQLIANTSRMSTGQPLMRPSQADDEIACLGHFFYQTNLRLERLKSCKSELTTLIRPQIRTPLAHIHATLGLLLSGELGNLSPKAQDRLQIAEKETARLMRLVNDLLDVKTMEEGLFTLNLADVLLADVLQTSIAAVSYLAESRNVRIETETSAAGVITVDRDRLNQVIINLLSNAIKFSPSGGSVRIIAGRSNSRLHLRVVDRGRGIPARLQERIFDPFFQVRKDDATKKGGLGLGLSIAKTIVEQHGGTIKVASSEGRGSTFWLSLPLQINESQSSSFKSPIASGCV